MVMIILEKNRYSSEEISKHNKQDDLWVIYKGGVFDVTQFCENHPGGVELVLEYAGKDITEAIEELYSHSNYAFQILQEYKIGELVNRVTPVVKVEETGMKPTLANGIVNEDPNLNELMKSKKDPQFLDLSKPLIPQVWNAKWTKEYYLEQIHIPRYCADSPLFFESRLLNSFTRNTWQGVLVVWLPIITSFIIYSLTKLSIPTVLHLLIDGFVLWTLYEYIFHRLLFHMDSRLPRHQLCYLLHFTMHGVHHFLPMDRYRLVMPPLLMITLSVPVLLTWNFFINVPSTLALSAGSFIGYVIYDMMHYYFHHGRIIEGYLQRMKTYHMDHHYVNPNLGFGVSNLVWDAVFNTMLPIKVSS